MSDERWRPEEDDQEHQGTRQSNQAPEYEEPGESTSDESGETPRQVGSDPPGGESPVTPPDSSVEQIIEDTLRGIAADEQANGDLTPTKPIPFEGHHADDFVLFQEMDPRVLRTQTGYELITGIARGGMGVIYRARDPELDRDVAIKVLRRDHYDKPQLVQRFIDEAHIMSFLQHPGVAPVYGCGRCPDGRPFHAMKLVQGDTLADLLRRRGSLADDFAGMLSVFSSVCQTLAYTHSRGIVHLDLKPSNVMVGPFGEVHLMDWGLARPVASREASGGAEAAGPVLGDDEAGRAHHSAVANEHPGLGHTVGTPAYMSPEQAQGRLMDRRSDVFGLGAMLCEILTGRPPYAGGRSRSLLLRAARASLSKTLRRLDRCGADRLLVQLTKRCLASRPADRPADAGEVAEDIAAYKESAIARAANDMNRFFELSPDLFCIASTDGYFRRINANFARVLGYSGAELLTRPFVDFVHPDDRADTVRQMRVLNEGQPVVRFRNRYRAASGAYLTLEWTAKAIPAERVIFAVARHLEP